MNEYLSKKIRILSFFSIVGVVFCHAYNYYDRFLQSTTIIAEGTVPGAMLQFFISNALVRFAVPMFFMFSGYLFFVKFEFSWKGYLKKVLKRVYSLFVPFLLWTALAGGLLYFVYKLAGLERYSIVYEKIGLALTDGVWVWLINSPAFQLWYLADLFKLVLISPVIYWLVKKCKLLPVILFGILWILELFFIINYEGLFFFTIGAYLAVNKISITGMTDLKESVTDKEKYKRVTRILTILWIVGSFAYALISATTVPSLGAAYMLMIFYKINVATGIFAVWRLYDVNFGKFQNGKFINALSTYTVFIFVSHEPLQHLLTDVLLEKMVFNGAHTLVYFVLPVVMILACVLVGMVLKKLCPKVYSLTVGGRI